MISIYFDFETTSVHRVGQIIDFCFIAIDPNWNEIERHSGLVKISHLQLPEPGAVNVTNLNVEHHQNSATFTEREAIESMVGFINEIKKLNNDKVPYLIGYNSADFDIEHFRVGCIRNGFSPYKLFEARDIYLTVQYLYATNEDFRSKIPRIIKDGKEKISLKLEHVTKSLGLLTEEQKHESSFDVELTIKLARFLKTHYGICPMQFHPYGLFDNHESIGIPICVSEFSRSLTSPIKDMWKLLIRTEGNASFWVDLEKFQKKSSSREEAVKAVKRYKTNGGHLVWVNRTQELPTKYDDCAVKALQLLENVTAEEMYGESNCYIEQFIYRIRLDHHQALFQLYKRSPQTWGTAASEDIVLLAKRYWLDNCSQEEQQSEEYNSMFRRYCDYRYGGKLRLSNLPKDAEPDGKTYHPSLKQLFEQVQTFAREAKVPEKRDIFEKLERFYRSSKIWTAMEADF